MKVFTQAAVVSLALIAAAPVLAHHSFGAYNMNTTAAAAGTLKEFRWGAPHSSLVILAKDKAGKPVEMAIISGSPLMFSKQGFTPRDFKRGDKISVTYHPNTNGSPGGALASLAISGGRTFSDSEAQRIAPPAAN
ncbi:DUF6152 family protein [Sphingomonas glacialis]|uniref:Uncharacterized protein n=1 Tax=Sphingomonas glacialis TaxID=658225 RepID=A0A502G3V0_9SPHN|nr:DUF6152 family protein [Sphingomonas glacialis]TPG56495.1 hypothetical protein EAH76_02850 [Sphingomonas glacialis]